MDNRIDIIEELNYIKKDEDDSNKHEAELLNLVEKIIKEFTEKRSYLINDAAKGDLPEESVENEVLYYIDRNKIAIDVPDRETLIKMVKNYMFGFYVLQDLVDQAGTISDIRVFSYDNISIKVNGERKRTNVKFPSKKSYEVFYNYIVTKLGGSLDKRNAEQVISTQTDNAYLRISLSSKYVNCVDNPYIAIRILPKDKYSLETLKNEFHMLDANIYLYLLKAVQCGLNIIVCGKGGAGKTTLLNALLDKLPQNIAGVIIQEAVELHSDHPGLMFKKEKPKIGENDIEYSLRKLTKQAMTEDIDLIAIGEIKGPEALDLMKIIGTGHIGWAAVHTNSSEEAPDRLADYMMESGTKYEKPELLRMLKPVDAIIFLKNFKIAEITEVSGFDEKAKELKFNKVFEYDPKSHKFIKINESCPKVLRKFEYNNAKGEVM